MIVLSRALAPIALAAGALLLGCGNKPGPEDPAVAVATGIPAGALSASGVRFDPPSFGASPTPIDNDNDDGPHPLPKALPPDPFDPLGGVDAGPQPLAPHIKPPKKKGMEL